jgi:heme/copper-type cytochrome/quinol oxidase subunit 2
MTTLVTAEPQSRPPQDEAYDVVTVLVLMLGGFVVPVVGWLAGVVMLWASRRWSVADKWLGTVVWPAVVVVPAVTFCAVAAATQDAGPGFVVGGVVGVLALLVGLPAAFVRLLRAGRR